MTTTNKDLELIHEGSRIYNINGRYYIVLKINKRKDTVLLLDEHTNKYVGAWSLKYNIEDGWCWGQGHYFENDFDSAVRYIYANDEFTTNTPMIADTKSQELNYIFNFLQERDAYDFLEDSVRNQFKSLVTAYCLHHDINCDTKEWDDLLKELYQNGADRGYSKFEKLDRALGAWLS
jgi:hypothetical protein